VSFFLFLSLRIRYMVYNIVRPHGAESLCCIAAGLYNISDSPKLRDKTMSLPVTLEGWRQPSHHQNELRKMGNLLSWKSIYMS
jgi:hypothetical protein